MILQKPHITEKSAKANEKHNVYTFIIHPDANKSEIIKAINLLYKVKPVAVRIIKIKPEIIVKGGKAGMVKGFKKAMVTLKKGDSISFNQ